MRPTFWLVALGVSTLAAALPSRAGGYGPLVISRAAGNAEIKPLGPEGRWQPVKAESLVGDYLLRTGSRSWVHVAEKAWCVDPNSLVRIESAADFRIVVLRGRVSAADGKRGKSLFREYDTATRAGIVR